MGQPTPCEDSDAWFVADRAPKQGGEHDWDNLEKSVRARLTCLTRCRQRHACMEMALAYGEDNDYWVWGGYTGAERSRIRKNGHVKAPTTGRTPLNMERVDQFLDYHLSLQEATEMWGLSSKRGAYRMMIDAMWHLRDGDDWLVQPGDILQCQKQSTTSAELPSSVAAA